MKFQMNKKSMTKKFVKTYHGWNLGCDSKQEPKDTLMMGKHISGLYEPQLVRTCNIPVSRELWSCQTCYHHDCEGEISQ